MGVKADGKIDDLKLKYYLRVPRTEKKQRRIVSTHKQPRVQYLIVHAVDPVGPQQVDGLANEVCASTVEHPKAQVQMELIRCSFGVETLEGAEATLGPDEDRGR